MTRGGAGTAESGCGCSGVTNVMSGVGGAELAARLRCRSPHTFSGTMKQD
jgi:hypothetical protein